MFRLLGNIVSPKGNRARLSILSFHRVLPEPDPILSDEIDAIRFDQYLAFLKREFNVLPLGEACDLLARGVLPARAVCITFDDGYANNEEVALPILIRHGLTATFFVATRFLAGGCMFNDSVIEVVRNAPCGAYDLRAIGLPVFALNERASRRIAIDAVIGELKYRGEHERNMLVEQFAELMHGVLPKRLMMLPAQVKNLYDLGMEIGGHTVSHPILSLLDEQAARVEIVDGKHRLEEIIGAPVTVFAYPNGRPGIDYGPLHVRLVREAGFVAAVSTRRGIAHRGCDPFELPRFSPWDKNPRRLGARLLLNCASAWSS